MRQLHACALVTLALISCTGTIRDSAADPPGPGPDGAPPSPGDGGFASPMITLDFTPSEEDLLNPERGYYVGIDLVGGGNAAGIRAGGHSLAIALVRLDAFRDQPLDAQLLASLRAGFAEVRSAGIKVILRFEYNDSLAADASRDRILGHIAQLAPVLAANADVIAVMQAGFIGAWGEWHSSTNGLDNDSDRGAILRALLAALPSTRAVQVRTPMFKAGIFGGGPLGADQAWTDTDRARVGHHNDCFLASSSDFGTYDSPIATWEAYVAQEGQFVPVGGETCAVDSPRSDCEAATAEMEANHWSYLNSEYNQDVLDGWASQGCADTVARRLGHRLALRRVQHSEAVAPGGILELSIELDNLGFAAPFNPRPVAVVLRRGSLRWVVDLAGRDGRRLLPGASTLTARLRLPAGLEPGDDYELGLWLPDGAPTLREDPRYAIQLANAGVFEPATGINLVTRALRVSTDAPGEVDPAAEAMVELVP